MSDMNRRELIGGLAAIGVSGTASAANSIPQRTFGRTGEKISAIGLGGYHIGTQSDPNESIRIIRSAIDRGITFMDNCWDYNDGQSEIRMGQALRDGYRQRVFLMTKTDGRTRESTARQIDESLKRLQTDHIDLVQFHENIRLEDPDRFFGDGVAEAFLEAKKAGKTRYLGFTGHKDPLVHLRMLEMAKAHNYRFDAAQMPLNVMDAHFRSFGQQVVPVLVREGMAVLGMKPLASGAVVKSNTVAPIEALHYALNLPTSVVITGCDSMEILDQAIQAATSFKPLSQAEISSLLAKTREVAANGQFERFKTSSDFDGTAQHPEWMA
jgi:aryl-alcohol dehydrogenase-like predicted oxidoreductase